MELQLSPKMSRALQHEARRRHTTAENLAHEALEHRIQVLQSQPVGTRQEVQVDFERLRWEDVQRATNALLRFCKEHACDDSLSVDAIRRCADAAERRDASSLKQSRDSLNLHYKAFPDWLPTSSSEPNGSAYLGEVFHALLSYWLGKVDPLARLAPSAADDPEEPGV